MSKRANSRKKAGGGEWKAKEKWENKGEQGSLSTALSVFPEKRREQSVRGRSAFPEQRLVIEPREKGIP